MEIDGNEFRLDIIEYWRKYGYGFSKLALFSNIELSYLYFLKAIQFLHLDTILLSYYQFYYRNSKLFYQSGVFICSYLHKSCKYKTNNFGNFLNHLNVYHFNSGDSMSGNNNSTQENPSEEKTLVDWVNENAFQCEKCERTFKFETELKSHLKSHIHKSTIYECKFCSQKFDTNRALLEHLHEIHEDKYTFVCNKCGIGFLNKISLIKHTRSQHYQITNE